MDVDPPLFKRKKSRTTRVRETQNDEPEENNDNGSTEESPMTLAAKLKNKHKARTKPQSRLSFGVEEEGGGETFQVKKSELSRKMKLSSGAALTARMEPPVETTTSSVYTSDYIAQLKAANAAPPRPSPQITSQPAEAIEAYNADELEAMGMDDIADGVSFGSQQLHPRFTMESELKSFPTIGEAGNVIPGGSAVVEAKKKRERLRAIGAPNASVAVPQEEFISLSLTKREEPEYQGPHPESRLVREEDDLGDGEDEMAEFTGAQERVALGKKAKKEETKRRKAGISEMIEDVEQDEDEETREWEARQIQRNLGPDRQVTEASQKPVYKPAPIPAASQVPSISSSVARLTASLSALTTSHTQNTMALTNIGDERAALDLKEANLRKMVEAAEAKRAWFKEMQNWVESLADFLDVKFPTLEKLEAEHVSLLTERYGMVVKRRQEDDEDDACLFLRIAEPTMSEGVDDLGRLPPSANTGPQAPIRKARRADRERRLTPASDAIAQGAITDSELPDSDAADFQSAMNSLWGKIGAVLEDVQLKEFKDARLAVAERFADWRSRYPETYTGTWGGLGAVGAWEFWARLEMVGWDPLRGEVRTLDSFGWYTGLYDYSRPKPPDSMDRDEDDEEESPLGPDGDLVASMITTTVIPRICALIAGGAFDPYSMKDVRKVIDLAEQIEMSVARGETKFLLLVQAVTRVFSTAVNVSYDLIRTAVPHPSFDPLAFHARMRYLSRRLKLLNVLLRWRKYAGEKFGMMEMCHRLVKDVMLPVALGGWEVGGKDMMKKVAQVLPEDLSLPELYAHIGTS